MADTLDPKLVDKRTAERNLRKGLLDEKAYERFLKSLPDAAEKAVPVEATMGDEDLDEEYDDEDEAGETPEGTAQA